MAGVHEGNMNSQHRHITSLEPAELYIMKVAKNLIRPGDTSTILHQSLAIPAI